MSNKSTLKADAPREPDVERCPMCWGWIDRNRPQSKFEHQGPLPHPRKLNKKPEVFDNEMDIAG